MDIGWLSSGTRLGLERLTAVESPMPDGGDGSSFIFLNRVLADRVASGCRISGSGLIFMPTSNRFVMFASQHVICTFFDGTLIMSSSVT